MLGRAAVPAERAGLLSQAAEAGGSAGGARGDDVAVALHPLLHLRARRPLQEVGPEARMHQFLQVRVQARRRARPIHSRPAHRPPAVSGARCMHACGRPESARSEEGANQAHGVQHPSTAGVRVLIRQGRPSSCCVLVLLAKQHPLSSALNSAA